VRQAHGHRFFMYDAAKGVYLYPSHTDRDVGFHHVGAVVYLDGDTGEYRGIALASGGDWATTFTTWVSAIHTAVFEGQLIHALVCLTGLGTALLSVTGVWIWWKKRGFRADAGVKRAEGRRRRGAGELSPGEPERGDRPPMSA